MTVTKEDRRKKKPEQSDVSKYKPSIARVNTIAQEMLSEHDKSFYDRDPEKWQTDYSLLNHCQAVSKTASDAAEYIGLPPEDVLVAEVAGALHDLGKINEKCHLYRLNRVLDDREMKSVDLHAGYSGNYISKLMKGVRDSDLPFWHKVRNTAPFHHQPWLLPQDDLRKIAWILKAADCLVACQEHRHHGGKTQSEVVEKLRGIFSYRMPAEVSAEYGDEIEEVLSGFIKLYSTPSTS